MTEPAEHAATRWSELAGESSGARYSARFAALAASGQDVHGEAGFCATLVPAPARVLDAGCGTGRVAIRLAELGYSCLGIDLDASMLEQASAARPDLPWQLADLARYRHPEPFELVIAAGNVIPLLAVGTLQAAVGNLTSQLRPGGLLVSGFGLDRAHLPAGCPVTPLAAFDAAAGAAGLQLLSRHSGWDGERGPITGYAVSVHAIGGG
ncbi:MAG: class I SAM-dependent methyltransferase [Jatrophihabitantaceae bacterium]